MILLQQFCAGDVARHEVGRELHARELEVECLCDRLDEERLGKSGDTDEQHVTAGQEGRHEIVYDLVLPDNAPSDLLDERRASAGQVIEELDVA